jgi:hypothetical protein
VQLSQINNLKYRILPKMAPNILVVSITIVASKLTFSVGGRVIDPILIGYLCQRTIQCYSEGQTGTEHFMKKKK